MRRLLSIALAFTLAPWLTSGVRAEQIHSERSLYRNIFVVDEFGQRCLTFRRSAVSDRQTCIKLSDPDYLVFSYTRMMLGALLLKPDPQRILIIGLGGGTLPTAMRNHLPNAEIDTVEIDPAVTRVAEKFFGFRRDEKLRVHEEDGRVFVKKALLNGAHYDIVMLDAFEDEYIPEHLTTREFLTEVKSLLTPGGVVVANTFSSSRLYDHESATYESVFGTFYNLKEGNRVIWAQNGTLTDKETLKANAEALEPVFRKHGFGGNWLVSTASTARDWRRNARLLTDQYSPSNILNAR